MLGSTKEKVKKRSYVTASKSTHKSENVHLLYLHSYLAFKITEPRDATPQLRWLVASFSTQRPGFSSRVAHVGFVVNKVPLVQVFLQAPQFSLVYHHFTNASYPFIIGGCYNRQSTKGLSLITFLQLNKQRICIMSMRMAYL